MMDCSGEISGANYGKVIMDSKHLSLLVGSHPNSLEVIIRSHNRSKLS